MLSKSEISDIRKLSNILGSYKKDEKYLETRERLDKFLEEGEKSQTIAIMVYNHYPQEENVTKFESITEFEDYREKVSNWINQEKKPPVPKRIALSYEIVLSDANKFEKVIDRKWFEKLFCMNSTYIAIDKKGNRFSCRWSDDQQLKIHGGFYYLRGFFVPGIYSVYGNFSRKRKNVFITSKLRPRKYSELISFNDACDKVVKEIEEKAGLPFSIALERESFRNNYPKIAGFFGIEAYIPDLE